MCRPFGRESPQTLQMYYAGVRIIVNQSLLLAWVDACFCNGQMFTCRLCSILVDPASSHMLVSKIKPCMSQYEFQHDETVNSSLIQLYLLCRYLYMDDCGNSRTNTCTHACLCGKVAFIGLQNHPRLCLALGLNQYN